MDPGNAIKFSCDGASVRVRVSRSKRCAAVEVSDTGVGIADVERERLFHPFSRTASATRAKVPGTGLGLFLSRMIVKAHGATIALESAEGRGTTMHVELPAAPELSAGAEPETMAPCTRPDLLARPTHAGAMRA